jgi:cytoskeletal protein CcmA (bactofilin family)
MQGTEDATTLGRSVMFRGELTGSGPLVIEGTVDGVVRVPGARVTIGKEARVRGAVQAQDVVIYGALEGEVYASGRIELRGGATFDGDLFAARLSIEDFAAVRANVDPSRAGGEPGPYKPLGASQPRPGSVPAQRMPLIPGASISPGLPGNTGN